MILVTMWAHYNQLYSAFSFIGFILCCIPVPWHLQAWNAGTCLYMFWTGLACLNQFINSIIWNANTIDWAPVWCDISSRILVAVSIAIPTAGLLINRRLWLMTRIQVVNSSKSEKRGDALIEVGIGIGVPLVLMVLYYVGEGRRYDIWEDLGCLTGIYPTPVALALIVGPPILVSLTSLVFAALAIKSLARKRKVLKELLSEYPDCNTNRYARLMALAGTEALLSTPCTVITLGLNLVALRGILPPWRGWADTHQNFSQIFQVPAAVWRDGGITAGLAEFSRWIVVFCAFLFFGFFGFAQEARKNYRAVFGCILGHTRRLRRRALGVDKLAVNHNTSKEIPEPRNRSLSIEVV